MTLRIAINGFGRIGRMILRAYTEYASSDIKIVAINDLGSITHNAHLFQYDSVHGRFKGPVKVHEQKLDVGKGDIQMFSISNPSELPWKEWDVDLVFECSGRFTDREDAALHLKAGAKRVLVSAPSKGADLTVVYGVNHQKIQHEHQVISNASCTTNCLAPLAYVLQQTIGIHSGFMTTIHSYTGDQRLVDTLHSDLLRARAAGLSMIPSTTGAAKAVGLVLPELSGKLDGTSIRVPTPNVSVVDFKVNLKRKTTVTEINDLLGQAASTPLSKGGLSGILGVNTESLVSCDFNHDTRSSIVDLNQTHVIDGSLVRLLSWYDNEWGFSNRMLDVAQTISLL